MSGKPMLARCDGGCGVPVDLEAADTVTWPKWRTVPANQGDEGPSRIESGDYVYHAACAPKD
jgi:hypothetical protein